MRKFVVILCVVFCFVLTSCEIEELYKEGYLDGYNDGYVNGYDIGTEEASDRVSGHIAVWLSDLDFSDSETGVYPYKAIQTLRNYAIGEPVTEEDLCNAIWTIEHYYNEVHDVIHELEDYYYYP